MMNSTISFENVGWTAEPSADRGTRSILYSCLFTLFLCSWSAVHLDVPREHSSAIRIFMRKMMWMGITIFAPEYVTTCAFREWLGARSLVKLINLKIAESVGLRCSMTQAFFIRMSGLKILHPNGIIELCDPLDVSFLPISILEKAEHDSISDKSKASWMNKCLICLQVSWFIVQLLGRGLQRLPTSSLELFTLAIVICALATYAFWWHKPLDVTTSLVVGVTESEYRVVDRRPQVYHEFAPSSRDLGVDIYWLSLSYYTLFILATSLVFGGVHLIAWNWIFPSSLERILWRLTSIICAVTPAMFCLTARYLYWATEEYIIYKLRQTVEGCLITLYLICRSYMLIEIFIGLRSMPAGVYNGVTWSQYLPHI